MREIPPSMVRPGERQIKRGQAGLVCHTPDPRQYHMGPQGLAVPFSDADGQPPDVKIIRPGRVRLMTIGAESPEGEGFFGEIDFSKIEPEVSKALYKASEGDQLVYYRLMAEWLSRKDAAMNQPIPVPVVPAPQQQTARPIQHMPAELSQVAAPAAGPAALPQPSTSPPHPAPPDLNGTLTQIGQTLAQLVQLQLAQRDTVPSQGYPVVAQFAPAAPPAAMTSPTRGTKIPSPAELESASVQAPQAGSFDFPIDLRQPPQRPQLTVFYNMGQAGRMKMSYHHISYTNENPLVLYLDTRYDAGQEFVPPVTSPDGELIMEIPSLGKSFQCSFTGIQDQIGCILWMLFIVREVRNL